MSIKTCPFCGSEDLEIGRATPDREGVPMFVICENCGCCGPLDCLEEGEYTLEVIAFHTGWDKRSGDS